MRWRSLASAALLSCVASLMALAPVFAQTPLRELIDAETRKAWDREKVAPVAPADDATLLRRLYLDLCGAIPTLDEAKAFIDDKSADKVDKLIDRLIADPRFAQHQADLWDMIYFGRNPPGFDSGKREGFQKFLRDSFAKNVAYDEVVRKILRAEGNTAEEGAPMYLVQYDRHPEDAAMAVSQTFLGVQLQCARCHDHPYENWTQKDFYGMAAFFVRLNAVKAGKAGNSEKIYVGEMNTGEVKFTGKASEATPGKDGEPVKPKFLTSVSLEEPDLKKEFKDEKRHSDGKVPAPPKFSRKNQLADWVVSPENPYFAKAAVNRFWSQYFGRGLVHPVDNMSPSNAATHPELLDEMTKAFVAKKYDMKWLIGEFCRSKTYQLGANGEVADSLPQWYQRARTRPLSAEELLESWRIATGFEEVTKRSGKKQEGRYYGLTFDYIKNFFGEPVNGVGDFQGGLSEHLYLNNGELSRLFTTEKGGLLDTLSGTSETPESRVEKLFLAVLSRRPSEAETTKFVEYLNVGDKEKEKRSERIREAIWALMTCSEFRFNH